MRGKVNTLRTCDCTARITPAYAGKRSASHGHVETVRDHPRLCGEKFLLFSFEQFRIGSPPPMRGKDASDCGQAMRAGITPAYAGKS